MIDFYGGWMVGCFDGWMIRIENECVVNWVGLMVGVIVFIEFFMIREENLLVFCWWDLKWCCNWCLYYNEKCMNGLLNEWKNGWINE